MCHDSVTCETTLLVQHNLLHLKLHNQYNNSGNVYNVQHNVMHMYMPGTYSLACLLLQIHTTMTTIITTKAPAAPAMYMMTPCVYDGGGSVTSFCSFTTDRFVHKGAELLITQQKDPVSDGVGLSIIPVHVPVVLSQVILFQSQGSCGWWISLLHGAEHKRLAFVKVIFIVILLFISPDKPLLHWQ